MERSTDIVVQGYGASLRKKENRFVLAHEGETREFPAGVVRQILVSGEATVTSAALRLAAEEGIDVVFCLPHGAPSCRVVPCHGKGIAETRRAQLLAANRPEGYALVAEVTRAKVHNMGHLLAALGRRRGDETLRAEGERILAAVPSVPQAGILPRDAPLLRGAEGNASRHYFAALARVIPPPLYLGTRTRHPAADAFNACLNYGYGILYAEVERACILAGLDPHAGFLHADRYGHLSLVYDLIEQFRQPVVDRAILSLAVRGEISAGDMDGRGYLSPDAKRTVTVAVFSRLDDARPIDGREASFRAAIGENIHSLARSLREGSPYTAFRWGYGR
ncbi:MAG: CRISPR-associated endonuclease Cas1 [Methanolinea sp.]|nr:CRISPR-associated endonuclease Cas1 [Methanolinea sp.]